MVWTGHTDHSRIRRSSTTFKEWKGYCRDLDGHITCRSFFNYGRTCISVYIVTSAIRAIKNTKKSDLKGKVIAVIKGTTSQKWGEVYETDSFLTKNLDEAINLLEEGKVDGVIFDEAPLRYYLKNHKGSTLKLANFPLAIQTYGFVLPTGSQIRNPLNIELLDMQRNGDTKKIQDHLLD